MELQENQDIRSQLLLWLQPFIFVLLILALILLLQSNPTGTYERQAYSLLIGFLLGIDGIAYFGTLKNMYRLSSILTVSLSLIGSWGSIYIDSRLGITEFFPLIYVTITVLLSSLLLPILSTIILASVQLVVLISILSTTPALRAHNWASFIFFVLFTSVLSIVANYISSYHLKQFKENSIRDHLTGLLNRRYFDGTLEDKVHRGESKGMTYGVMLMDVDNFKKFNDQYNHATGDIILQRVSSFLVDTLEASAIACRYGGDEFAIMIIDTDYARLYGIAQDLRTEVKNVDITDTCKTGEKLSISIGLALFPENGNTTDLLMAHADRNLMEAKKLGKDLVMPRYPSDFQGNPKVKYV
ncbi:MAG: GGDEF domain-containing protein [Sphaerochaeta sp.]|nr:GGDEF domain-containing protein [Sphaerochaeta sp.]